MLRKGASLIIAGTIYVFVYWCFLVLALLTPIALHEGGHYFALLERGVAVERFAVGIGPNLTLYRGEHTTFSVGVIPFLGYNKPYTKDDPSAVVLSAQSYRMAEDLTPAENLWVGSAGLLANALSIGALLVLLARYEAGQTLIIRIQEQLKSLPLLICGIGLDLFTLGRYPRSGSRELKTVTEYVSFKVGFVKAMLRLWVVVHFTLIALNILPVAGLDGTRMAHACCALLGFHVDFALWATVTSPIFLFLMIGRSFVRRAA